jgi:hypothetical protein
VSDDDTTRGKVDKFIKTLDSEYPHYEDVICHTCRRSWAVPTNGWEKKNFWQQMFIHWNSGHTLNVVDISEMKIN